MLSKSRVFSHGNVVAQSIGGSAHNIANYEAFKPYRASYEVSKSNLDETFTIPNINQQKKVEPFDTATGIISNSPEIIAFSNFIPVYDNYNNLNSFGEYLQTKQDALLVRSSRTVENLIMADFAGALLKDSANNNAAQILEYLQNQSAGIEQLLNHFSLIRKKLDFRYPVDINVLKLIGVLPPDYVLNDPESQNFYASSLPLKVDEILNESPSVTDLWTPTKIWLQSCLELKEVLANGMPQSFLSDGTTLGIDPHNKSYYDALSLNQSRSSLVKKFGFNDKQILTYPIQNIVRASGDTVRELIAVMTPAFSSGDINTSIFNQKIFSDVSNIDESIARLSHILCKEYVYSTKMRSEVVVDYGYPFNFGGKNANIWNYFIGQVGADVTDISSAPLGGGKSLVSLSQTVEPDGTEVLTFEDRYINDNVGTVRPNVVITPGTFYYLESSINPTTAGFDVTRLNRYLTRLNSSTNMLKMVKEDLMFKPEIPYSSILNKITTTAESGVTPTSGGADSTIDITKNQKQEEINTALSNPINLLRHIEKNIFGGSGLLRRTFGPKLWTNKNPNDVETDVSALLISLALDKDDADLQALLFLHQLYAISSSTGVSLENNPVALPTPNDATVKTDLVEAIMFRIRRLLEKDVVNSRLKTTEEISISLSIIKDALMSKYSSANLKILNQIGTLLLEFDENFDKNDNRSRTNGRFFLDQMRNTGVATGIRTDSTIISNLPVDKRSAYSGVQKTLYLVSMFKLCCLMVHLANPERLGSIKKPNVRGQGSDKITINKIKNTVVGVFLNSGELNEGIKLDLLENDVTGKRSFKAGEAFNPVAHVNKVHSTIVTDVKKINSNKNIKIFELPSAIKSGTKIYGNGANTLGLSSFNQPRGRLVALHYDDVMVKVENMLADYDKKMLNFVNKFYSFVYDLKNEFTILKNNLQLKSGLYGRSLLILTRQIANPILARSLLSEEQLTLMRSKFEDYAVRLKKDYISPVRDSIPHFQNLKNVQGIEFALPIEDVHLVSWNTFLKSFLAAKQYTEGPGSNKKIISVGIPQKLHRRMRVDSSKLSGLRHRNSLIKLNIYRVNSFLPDVIYKPKTYLFDLKLFPTRILKNFIDNGFSVSRSEDITTQQDTNSTSMIETFSNDVVNFIPHLKNTEDYNFTLVDVLEKFSLRDSDYSFLSDDDFNQIFDNHSISFLLEEYLRYVTDLPFDEQKYQQYAEINPKTQTQFSKFVTEAGGFQLPATAENFYNDETLLTDQNAMIKSLILPKKFDRVFHVIFDPDDFEIDERTPKKVIEKYVGIDGDISSLSRNDPNEPTFDKYYTALETYEGNDAS